VEQFVKLSAGGSQLESELVWPAAEC